uniref:Uncharacterized protein n=1 Tax=Arundo donax TaxID=35708 RepID=A0A0A8XUC8_ARUDO
MPNFSYGRVRCPTKQSLNVACVLVNGRKWIAYKCIIRLLCLYSRVLKSVVRCNFI